MALLLCHALQPPHPTRPTSLGQRVGVGFVRAGEVRTGVVALTGDGLIPAVRTAHACHSLLISPMIVMDKVVLHVGLALDNVMGAVNK